MKRILIYTGVVLTCILAGWLVGRYHKEKSVVVTERVDTVFVHDTFTIEKPILKESKIIETMLVAVRDTIVKNDTTYIPLPRESKTYGDDRFTAVVSGYKPSLDRLDIYIESLRAYRQALANDVLQTLTALLEEGKKRKEEVDG